MARRGRRAAREEEMRGLLGKWERSGLPLSRFAEREGIAQKTMYWWRRRLGAGGERVRRGRPVACVDGQRATAQSASMFTEVSSALRRPSSLVAVTFEVVLGSGTTLRVPEHFDAGALRILLQTLREC